MIKLDEYEVGGYVYVTTDNRVEMITKIIIMADGNDFDDSDIGVSLSLGNYVTSYTQYLSLDLLRELYPYIGKDTKAIKLLYGAK